MRKLLYIILPLLISCQIRDPKKNSIDNLAKQDSLTQTQVMVYDSVYDFGTIKEGDIVEFSFKFKNTGKYPLIITNTSASCGCTVPEKPEEPIQPGNDGEIKVKFNSSRREGNMNKHVVVTSNATFPQLLLKGTVEKQ
ncbi:MAG: DUF1573 domain-containing protein [Bacteroidetes bacterium]|nr:DUF1573 domain-containing protein [Bacteroidota bacterium]